MNVALYDEGIDLMNSELMPFLDKRVMKLFEIPGTHASERQRWISQSAQLTRFVNSDSFKREYADQIDFRDKIGRFGSKEFGFLKKIGLMPSMIGGGRNYLLAPEWRSKFNETLEFLHGTHMAGLVVKELDPKKVRLLSFPAASSLIPDTTDWDQLINHFLVIEPVEKRLHLEAVSKGLKKTRVKVVNIATGWSVPNAFKYLKQLAKEVGKNIKTADLQKLAQTLAQADRAEMEHFIQSNPDTVFVLAAGNESMNLDERGEKDAYTASLKAKNLIVVGGIGGSGRSNFGKRSIDVLAPSSGIEGLRAGGGTLFMPGTSVASAVVTNRIAKIYSDNPELGTSQVIERVRTQEVDGRRRLISCSFGKLIQSGK